MALILEHLSRNVIPRWRNFATTLQLGELKPVASGVKIDVVRNLGDLEADWETNRTISFAADLVSAAVMAGASEVASEAALFILEHADASSASRPLVNLAKTLLGRNIPLVSEQRIETRFSLAEMQVLIAHHRSALKGFPRDAILWVDLSLLFAMQGLTQKAERAMLVALTLSPENRFVLRSAARCFIHLNKIDRAHQLLHRSSMIKIDPWLMSAEIATATAGGLVPRSVDRAVRVLTEAKFGAEQTTELSAAMATLEFRDGNRQKAKKQLRAGLRKPNENSLAQAKWLQTEMRSTAGEDREPSVLDFHVERSYEALTWEAFFNKQWLSATSNAISWMRDQPFSSRPAFIAAQLSSTLLEDWNATEILAKEGLRANPQDHSLHILLAFTYGSTARLDEAKEHLAKIKGATSSSTDVAILANQGLIKFRAGLIDDGRRLYEAAVTQAKSLGSLPVVAAATTYWAREEVRAKTAVADSVLKHASLAVEEVRLLSLEAPVVLERIVKQHREQSKSQEP